MSRRAPSLPDGKLLLTASAGQGFALTPLDGGRVDAGSRSRAEDKPLRWTADGRVALRGEPPTDLPARVFRVDLDSGRRELWKEFTPGDATGITGMGADSISADGKTILFGYFHMMSDLYVAQGLR